MGGAQEDPSRVVRRGYSRTPLHTDPLAVAPPPTAGSNTIFSPNSLPRDQDCQSMYRPLLSRSRDDMRITQQCTADERGRVSLPPLPLGLHTVATELAADSFVSATTHSTDRAIPPPQQPLGMGQALISPQHPHPYYLPDNPARIGGRRPHVEPFQATASPMLALMEAG